MFSVTKHCRVPQLLMYIHVASSVIRNTFLYTHKMELFGLFFFAACEVSSANIQKQPCYLADFS